MTDAVAMETTTKHLKRKKSHPESNGVQKRSKLTDMVFFDGNRHPAAVLHELRPDVSPDKYHFEQEESGPKQVRFRCSLTIGENVSEPITAVGLGRSKQIAKNMAAQVELHLLLCIRGELSELFSSTSASVDKTLSDVSSTSRSDSERRFRYASTESFRSQSATVSQ